MKMEHMRLELLGCGWIELRNFRMDSGKPGAAVVVIVRDTKVD
jgi:hypothetical protein